MIWDSNDAWLLLDKLREDCENQRIHAIMLQRDARAARDFLAQCTLNNARRNARRREQAYVARTYAAAQTARDVWFALERSVRVLEGIRTGRLRVVEVEDDDAG